MPTARAGYPTPMATTHDIDLHSSERLGSAHGHDAETGTPERAAPPWRVPQQDHLPLAEQVVPENL